MGDARIGRRVIAHKIGLAPVACRREAAAREASIALRKWRCAAGIDQADAAAELDCSVRQLREWESGRVCPPGWVVVLVMGWSKEAA